MCLRPRTSARNWSLKIEMSGLGSRGSQRGDRDRQRAALGTARLSRGRRSQSGGGEDVDHLAFSRDGLAHELADGGVRRSANAEVRIWKFRSFVIPNSSFKIFHSVTTCTQPFLPASCSRMCSCPAGFIHALQAKLRTVTLLFMWSASRGDPATGQRCLSSSLSPRRDRHRRCVRRGSAGRLQGAASQGNRIKLKAA